MCLLAKKTISNEVTNNVEPALQLDGKPATETVYCVKCKSKQEFENKEAITMKNNKKAFKGTCKTCKKPVFKLAKKDEVI